jgi:hypothetical protein
MKTDRRGVGKTQPHTRSKRVVSLTFRLPLPLGKSPFGTQFVSPGFICLLGQREHTPDASSGDQTPAIKSHYWLRGDESLYLTMIQLRTYGCTVHWAVQFGEFWMNFWLGFETRTLGATWGRSVMKTNIFLYGSCHETISPKQSMYSKFVLWSTGQIWQMSSPIWQDWLNVISLRCNVVRPLSDLWWI